MNATINEPPVRILHLSDLHFSARSQWDADPILRALAGFIAKDVADNDLHPDLVIITGDIAQSGKPDEYALAREWLNDLWPQLTRDPASPLGRDRLLLVPGNHDVDWNQIEPGARDAHQALLAAKTQAAITARLKPKATRNLLLERHAAYLKFYGAWLARRQTLPWWQRSILIGAQRLHVAGLDSAWLAEHDDDSRLLLSTYQINQTVLHRDGEGDHDWRLALLHHPWASLAEFDRNDAQRTLYRHRDLVLRGHLHQPDLFRIVPADPRRSCIEAAAGCCYSGKPYPNAFQWIELYRNPRRVKFHFRCWNQDDWQVDRHQHGCPEGTHSIGLPGPDIDGPCHHPPALNMADPPKVGFVARQELLTELRQALLNREHDCPVVALLGTAGYGKTTLAQSICHDGDIREIFHDGVLWVELGQEPGDLTVRVLNLIQRLTRERPGYSDLHSATSHLRDLLEDRAVLVVIDDLWKANDAQPFLVGGRRCASLITSRHSDCLPRSTVKIPVDQMVIAEARSVLGFGLDGAPPRRLDALAKRLGCWAQLLALANAWLFQRVDQGRSIESALEAMEAAYDAKGLVAFDAKDTPTRELAIGLALSVSLNELAPATAVRFEELAVFPPDLDIPLAAIEHLWAATAGLGRLSVDDLCSDLKCWSLLQRFDPQANTLRLHDVIRAELERRQAKSLPSFHSALLDSYQVVHDWWSLPADEPYLWQHLTWHLLRSGRTAELKYLLLDFRWLAARLKQSGVGGLLDDFERVGPDVALRLVAGALRLSAPILAQDPAQLPMQLRGRLSADSCPGLAPLFGGLDSALTHPTLLHRFPGLEQPGGMLLCRFEGHADQVTALAVSADRKRLLSGSSDATVYLSTVEIGTILAPLNEHDGSINAVAFTGHDETERGLSGSEDWTVILWDLARGKPVLVLKSYEGEAGPVGHRGAVTALANIGEGGRVLSGSDDGTLVLWDLETGNVLKTIDAESGAILALAAFDQGTQALVATTDGRLRVWNLATGRPGNQGTGVSGDFAAMAVVGDGPRVLVGKLDGSVILGDLNKKDIEVQSLVSGKPGVTAIAVFGDGQHAVSGHRDGTLILWDLQRQTSLCRRFRPDRIHALAALDKGFQVLVASGENRLDLLDLDANETARPLAQHAGWVTCVAILDAGSRALSGGSDGKLRLWDTQTGDCLSEIDTGPSAIQSMSNPVSAGWLLVSSENGKLGRFDLGAPDSFVELKGYPSVEFKGYPSRLTALSILGDERQVVLGCADGSLWIVDHQDEKPPILLGRQTSETSTIITGIMPLPGDQLLTGCSDGSQWLWDLNSREGLLRFPSDAGEDAGISAFGITTDGKAALTGWTDGELRLRELGQPHTSRSFSGAWRRVTGVAMIAGTAQALTSTDDRKLRLWDLQTAVCLATLVFDDAPSALAITPDGQIAVVGDSSGKIHFIEVRRV